MLTLERSLPALLVVTLAVACGSDEKSTKGGSGGHAGSSAGAPGGKSGGAGTDAGTGAAAGDPGASGGRGGTGGSGARGGKSATGGGGTSAGSGGEAAAESGTGGDTGDAGAGDTSTNAGASFGGASDGGAGNGVSSDVHGRIIDFWGHPLAGAPVAIGGVRVVTDSNGAFVVPDVTAEYDVSFIVTWDDPLSKYGWVYQGLTRRDPTLQVFRAFNAHSVSIEIHQVADSAPFTDDYRWLLGFGSANGNDNVTSGGSGVERLPSWEGPASNDWTLHSLYVLRASAIPTSYRAYATRDIPVADGDPKQHPLDIDLSEQTLATGNVSGSVTPNAGTDAANYVFVRFTSGAELPVVNGVARTSPYTYLVPSLANGSITVASSETQSDGAYAIVHRDGLAPGATDIALSVPAPTTPTTPANTSQGVDDDTVFSFGGGEPDAHAYLVHLEDQAFRDGMFIVTAKKQFTLGDLPIVNGEFHITAGQAHDWWVETHGTPASVDAMAAPGGFADDFALNGDRPAGPVRSSGALTISRKFEFQTAP